MDSLSVQHTNFTWKGAYGLALYVRGTLIKHKLVFCREFTLTQRLVQREWRDVWPKAVVVGASDTGMDLHRLPAEEAGIQQQPKAKDPLLDHENARVGSLEKTMDESYGLIHDRSDVCLAGDLLKTLIAYRWLVYTPCPALSSEGR